MLYIYKKRAFFSCLSMPNCCYYMVQYVFCATYSAKVGLVINGNAIMKRKDKRKPQL